MRDRAIATHRGDLVACDVVSNAIGNSVNTAGARVGAVTFKVGGAVGENQSPGSRVSHVLVQSYEIFPYRGGPVHQTPVIERCPRHIRGVAVRKVLTCAHALEVAVNDPFSCLFSHTAAPLLIPLLGTSTKPSIRLIVLLADLLDGAWACR